MLASISCLEKESPDFEFNEGYGYGFKKEEVAEKSEREIAIESLKDLSKVFPQNAMFAEAGTEEAPRQVAIKRTKMNAFNDRDGVAFYALREIKLLQQLQSQYKADCRTVQITDVFFVPIDCTVCIVMELLDGESLYD